MMRFDCYENFKKDVEENSESGEKRRQLLLQYKILFRRWDVLKEEDDILFRRRDELKEEEFRECLERNVFCPCLDEEKNFVKWDETDFTIGDLLRWNAGYYNSAVKKNGAKDEPANDSNLMKAEDEMADDSNLMKAEDEMAYYSDFIIDKGKCKDNDKKREKSLFDLFFPNQYPMLDIKFYPAQTRAAKKLKYNRYHLIFDEVGTGKTVSALYCIRDVLAKKGDDAKVLIICPNNKKTEWQKDIKRQLGLYAHLVQNRDEKEIYSDNLKKIYFQKHEPFIFIEGQKSDEMKDSLNQWLSFKENDGRIRAETDEGDSFEQKDLWWDIAVIDEGHLCFDNYRDVRAEKAVLLTATPVVIHSKTKDGWLNIEECRKIKEYEQMLYKMTTGMEKDGCGLNDLFAESEHFTQLFREDLGIEPKRRNIVFEYCDRMENREVYLNILSGVKGGMARLFYEQDDEHLLYGIYHKFKDGIEGQGYLLPDEKPIKNYKYEKLKEYICHENRCGKSYIIFFNVTWLVEHIYKRLIKDLPKNPDLILGWKMGSDKFEVFPNDQGVSADHIFDYLIGKIRERKRVIFLTTGASGGTGLNLGDFDGIIHYELPFTSIELEQRFGRVDRMDVNVKEEKEMLFLLNKDSNPMLRYSSLKINKTCEYMPIRNTILFCPGYINANIKSLRQELDSYGLKDDEKENFVKLCELKKNIAEDDKKDQELIRKAEQYIRKKRTLKEFMIDEDCSEKCKELLKFMHDKEAVRFYDCCIGLANLKPEIENWCSLLGVSKEGNIYGSVSAEVSEETDDDGKGQEGYCVGQNGEIRSSGIIVQDTKNKDAEIDVSNILVVYEDLQKLVNQMKDTENSQVATGVFYLKDQKYYRKSVDEYRMSVCSLDIETEERDGEFR